MLTPARTARRGVTLIEMLVAMVVAGLVMTLLTLAGLRQHRLLSDLLDDSAMSDRLREASALLPIALRSLGASAGDVRDARDTALEVRATIGGGIVCDTARGALVLPAATADAGTYASYSTSVQPGDTAWLLDPGDAARTWVPHAVTSVSAAPAGQCGPRGPRLSPDVAARPRTAVTLDSAPAALAIGRPLRVTRPLRFSLYRSADGSWNLGERDWNPSLQRFNSIQPVAGPFLSASAAGLTFVYLDSTRAVLPTPVVDTRSLAAIAFTVRGQSRDPVRALGAASQQGPRRDTAAAVVLLRNRR